MTDIVIDIGCATYSQYPEDESIHRLIGRFKPKIYYGFDPHPSVLKTAIFENSTRVLIEPKAAWIYDGFIGYTCGWNPLRATTGEMEGPAAVPCFDLGAFIERLGEGETMLKIDAEGAEYTLLPNLHERGLDERLSLLLVEWHGDPLDLSFRCAVEIW